LHRKEKRRKTLHDETWIRGVLLLVKEGKLIPIVSPLLKAIQEAGLYLHNDLIERVLQIAGEK